MSLNVSDLTKGSMLQQQVKYSTELRPRQVYLGEYLKRGNGMTGRLLVTVTHSLDTRTHFLVSYRYAQQQQSSYIAHSVLLVGQLLCEDLDVDKMGIFSHQRAASTSHSW